MASVYWKTVLARAWREAREEVRWDTPVRVLISLFPLAVGLGAWIALGMTQPGFPVQALGTLMSIIVLAKGGSIGRGRTDTRGVLARSSPRRCGRISNSFQQCWRSLQVNQSANIMTTKQHALLAYLNEHVHY